MKTPHKHAEVIKAWADGAIIQYYDGISDKWFNIGCPSWSNCESFRVRPDPQPVYPVHSPYETVDNKFADAVLRNFVKSGALWKYVDQHGTDGLKGQ